MAESPGGCARGYDLPEREALVDAALVEIDELEASADMVVVADPLLASRR